MSVGVILNLNSGTLSFPENRDILLRALRDAGLDGAVVTVENGGEIAAAVRDLLEKGCETVAAGGGDGTINAVASLLVGTGINLGVIPGGTLNHFAADLKIPVDLAEAVDVLRTGVTKVVDVGAVNGRIFLNNSGLGLYPEMVMQREEIQRHGFRKLTALVVASALTLLRFPLLRVRLEANGQIANCATPFVFVGNNPYEVDGLRFGMRPCIDTGQLCVWVARRSRRLGLLRAVFEIAFRGLRGVKELDIVTTDKAVIKSRRKVVPVSIDGEVFKLRTPLAYEIRRASLHVIVPAPAAAGDPQ